MGHFMWLAVFSLFSISSCGFDMSCDVTISNKSDYEVKDIKITYGHDSGIESKMIDILQSGSSQKEELIFYSGPVLMSVTSSAIIQYYINGIKYGYDDLNLNENGGLNTNFPCATLVDGGHVVFTIKNEIYEIDENR
jgi:hypothetical protein